MALKLLRFIGLAGLMALVGWGITSSQADPAQAQQQQQRKLGILNQMAPELPLDTWIDGEGKPTEAIKLSELRGKFVYLYFFQDWCPGCQKYGFPALRKLHQAYKDDKGIELLAVQTVFEGSWINRASKLRSNQLEHRVPIPMAHDDGGENNDRSVLMSLYRTGGTPWTVVIDPEGKVVFNDFHIDAEKFMAYYNRVSRK